MDGYVKIEKSYGAEIILAASLAVFFVVFCLLYTPFGANTFFDCGGFDLSFHAVMLGAILLLCLVASRSVYHATYARKRTLWWRYAIWCTGEIVFASLFAALYTWLFKRADGTSTYLLSFSYCLRLMFFSLIFPYAMHILYQIVQEEDSRIEDLMRGPAGEEGVLMKFNDEHGRLRLAIDSSEILYLRAETNYIRIYYLEAGKVKEFPLRNSMKSVEPMASERSLVRCHRSYFVNPRHIKVLRKDKYGFVVAELNIPETSPIPISKTYYESIASLL